MASVTPTDTSGLDLWLHAEERYLDCLEPHEKTIFQEATLENLYYSTSKLEREDRSSKSRMIIQKLQPLVEKIDEYGKALDAYANIAPIYLAPLWGSIRVLMVIAKAYGKFYNRIVETLGRIGDVLPQFRDYERIFDAKKHLRLSQAISNTYFDIIELCFDFRKLLKDQKASLLKRIWKPVSLDGKFEEAIQRFREHRKIVDKEAQVCHMIEATETKALVQAHKTLMETDRKAMIRSRLLARLSCQDYASRHRTLQKLRHQDTGTWVMLSPEYKKWQSNNFSAVLSLYGIPGCGKSVLVSSIYDTITKSLPNSATIAYYCDYADKRTLDPLNIFGSLARALLRGIEIPSSVQTLIEKAYCDGSSVPQLHEVLDIFRSIVETSFESVTVLVDGLDELKEDERQLVYSSLRDLLRIKKTIKLFLSSRNDESQTVSLDSTSKYRICLLPEKISIDINAYIRHAVHTLRTDGRLAIRDPWLEREVLDALIDGAKGMFLWVKFQLEDLCTAETDADIRNMLQNLPKDLSETYDRLLGRIIGSQREKFIERMFKWILCSKRPLSVDEMLEAIAFTIDDVCWDESKIPNDMTRLLRACGNLVVINEETSTLQFAHYTVEQYLLSRSAPIGSATLVSLQQAEVTAAEVCLAYLSFTDFETQISTYVDNTTANMSAIESLVMRSSVLPNQQLANTALRIRSSVKGHNAKIPSSSIDYRQHIPPKIPLKNNLQENYRMLGYVVDFWLFHTSALAIKSQETSRCYVLFNNLLNRKFFYSGLSLWTIVPRTLDGDVLAIAKLGWAIKNNHILLLRALLDTWFLFSRINESMPHFGERIIAFEGECPDSEPDAIRWLYRTLLDAARRGQLEVFRNVAFSLNQGCLGCITAQAAKYSHFELVQYLLRMDPLPSKIQYLNEQGSLLSVNALEVAAFQGHLNIVELFVDQNGQNFHFDHPRAGVKTLISAIKQSNTSVVAALKTVLFSPMFFSNTEPSDEPIEPILLFETRPSDVPHALQDAIFIELLLACLDGDYFVAQQLLRQANYFCTGSLSSALVAATNKGNHAIMGLFFEVFSRFEFPNSEEELTLAFSTIAKFGTVQSFESLLEFYMQVDTDSVKQSRLLQTPLFAAATAASLGVVETLLALSHLDMTGHLEIMVPFVGTAHYDALAITQARRMNDSTALKTLVEGAVRTSNFSYIEACLSNRLQFLGFSDPQLPGINSLLKSAFNETNRGLAKNLVEMLLDLKPAAPWGTRETGGSEIDAGLLHVAGLCAKETRIALMLLSGRDPQEYRDKYNYMILYVAVKLNDLESIDMILNNCSSSDSYSSHLWNEMALSQAEGEIQKTLAERRTALAERRRVLAGKQNLSRALAIIRDEKSAIANEGDSFPTTWQPLSDTQSITSYKPLKRLRNLRIDDTVCEDTVNGSGWLEEHTVKLMIPPPPHPYC